MTKYILLFAFILLALNNANASNISIRFGKYQIPNGKTLYLGKFRPGNNYPAVYLNVQSNIQLSQIIQLEITGNDSHMFKLESDSRYNLDSQNPIMKDVISFVLLRQFILTFDPNYATGRRTGVLKITTTQGTYTINLVADVMGTRKIKNNRGEVIMNYEYNKYGKVTKTWNTELVTEYNYDATGNLKSLIKKTITGQVLSVQGVQNINKLDYSFFSSLEFLSDSTIAQTINGIKKFHVYEKNGSSIKVLECIQEPTATPEIEENGNDDNGCNDYEEIGTISFDPINYTGAKISKLKPESTNKLVIPTLCTYILNFNEMGRLIYESHEHVIQGTKQNSKTERFSVYDSSGLCLKRGSWRQTALTGQVSTEHSLNNLDANCNIKSKETVFDDGSRSTVIFE